MVATTCASSAACGTRRRSRNIPPTARPSGACSTKRGAPDWANQDRLTGPGALAAVDREHDAGHDLRLVGREVQRGVGDVPRGAHPALERHLRVALADE